MPYALSVLDGVRWNGAPVVGERPCALIRALVAAGSAGSSTDSLIQTVWSDEPPANPTKALQVQVSRVRSATDPRLIERTPRGYRLGLSRDEVDALAQADLRAAARAAYEAGQLDKALPSAQKALAIGPAAEMDTIVAVATSRAGEHTAALPLLEKVVQDNPADEHVLACLLRSEAAVRGPAAALERYERHRSEVADRVGSDPAPELQDVHRELLVADRPVRDGVRYDGTALLGREEDLRALRTLIASARVVSIVGAGGLGKTRLAHVVGRDAEQPIVHFVELVGVTAPDDVVGEVGSALGVRDSVLARKSLTPEQRADVRTRIAQQLASTPSLLILDNCEHVIDAVADLVAFLVATTRDAHIVTTSRAPLNIAAERVYALSQLRPADAEELFHERAVAARPNVALDQGPVTEIVDRLDGLPLAIELAAAKVRVMSVEDIARRLENRFTLLRGGDRTAPDRHQTLLAVIDWSWNLLVDDERRALRRLSVFHDGFTFEAAEAMLGPTALESVESLVQQSLLSVQDHGRSVRYRMLETVREFGRMQLVDAGEETDAARDQCAWACAYADEHLPNLFGRRQVETMDELRAEEGNLADVLRRALAESDAASVVVIFGALAAFWSVVGEHARIISMIEALDRVVAGWTPPPELEDSARVAAAVAMTNAAIAVPDLELEAYGLLRRLGPESPDPNLEAMCRVILAFDSANPHGISDDLGVLCESPKRHVARQALQYRSHFKENAGDPEGAVDDATRAIALSDNEDGPWMSAILQANLAGLYGQLGHHAAAAEQARAAIPVLDRLQASDDAIQCRIVLACEAMFDGRLDEAGRIFTEIEEWDRHRPGFGSGTFIAAGRAELLLLQGGLESAFAQFRYGIERARRIRFPSLGAPSGLEPWTLSAESCALAAYGLYGEDDDGRDLWDTLTARVPLVASQDAARLDYPVLGIVLYALGLWGMNREVITAHDATRLCVLAERFGYPRRVPTFAWRSAADLAEQRAPGVLDEVRAEYGDARGSELIEDARKLIDRLFPQPR